MRDPDGDKPPSPPSDPQNTSQSGGAGDAGGASSSGTSQQQQQQRQRDYDAYKKRCNESPPSSCQNDPCDLARWKLQRNIDCRRMRQEWDNRWQPGRHANDIANLDQSIKNLQDWIRQNCP